MPADKNRQILLAARPRGEPTLDDFRLVETEVTEPGPGRMLLRTVYLSLDPYMRGRMNAGPSYALPVQVGAVMEGRAVCTIARSNLPQYRAGDIVLAATGWQEYALSDGQGAQKVDPALRPISAKAASGLTTSATGQMRLSGTCRSWQVPSRCETRTAAGNTARWPAS